MSKIFVLSLPRTGTTSACLYLLDCGFKVAHTAFSDATFEQADVIADTPVFLDYQELCSRYPGSKFIYLERPLDQWTISIRRLLSSMRKQWIKDKTVFESEIRRCFTSAFPGFEKNIQHSDSYLHECYTAHKEGVITFFTNAKEELLVLDITEDGAGEKLKLFCSGKDECDFDGEGLPHVNKGRRITYWETIEHKNKINSKL